MVSPTRAPQGGTDSTGEVAGAASAFDGDQFHQAYPEGIERSWWSSARNRILTRAFERHVPRSSKVLEVGCGTGIVTAHLRDRGWDVWGVDIGAPSRGLHAAEHLMLGSDALALPEELRREFEVLALFDVIEHVREASSFLRELARAFPAVRTLLVTVPARQELWTTFDDHYGHFRRYDRSLLRAELSAAGFSTTFAGYFFHALYPVIAANNLLRGRSRRLEFHAPRPGLAARLHGGLGAIFALESRLLPPSWPGSSILAVGQRVGGSQEFGTAPEPRR